MQVSDYELELMKIIWAHEGTAMYSLIQEELNKKGEAWTKNTIITLLSRLVDKQMLMTEKIGRRNVYKALVTETQYQASQTKSFLDKVFEGNPKGLVSTLLESKLLTEEDYNEIKEFWEGEIERNE